MIKYSIFKTNMGWIGVLVNQRGVLRTTLPMGTRLNVKEYFTSFNNSLLYSGLNDEITLVKREINLYFSGCNPKFNLINMDLSELTNFSRNVLNISRKIPYGETRSYKWIAKSLGNPRSYRAVGQVLAKNPLPILIPCHRVIATSGLLQGFMGGKIDLDLKRRLIDFEKNHI